MMKRFLSPDTYSSSTYAFAFLFVLVLVVYGNTFHAGWHFDDRHSIVDNSKVHITELTLPVLSRVIQHPDAQRIWRPLAYLSFGLNWYIGQDRVFGYHVVNILLHLITAFILFHTLLCLFRTPAMREKTSINGAYITALLTAVLWAINPIQTQAVTYIVQRMTLMAALFYIGGLFFYLRARLIKKRRYRYLFFSFCAICWLLAMASKENAMLLPLTLILVEAAFFQDLSDFHTRRRYLIVFAAGILLIGIIGGILFLGNSPSAIFSGYSDRFFTPWERLITQPRVLFFYLTQIFFPHPARLSIDHDFAISTSLIHPWTTLPAILFVFGLLGSAVWKIARYPLGCFAVLFFFLNHLVESTIIPLEIVFEHRNYLPSMFLFAPVSAGAAWLISHQCEQMKRSCLFVMGVIISLLIAFGVGTYRRNRVWLNEVALWSDAYRKAPMLHRTVHNLAMSYYENTGRIEEALKLYYKADSLKMHRRSHRADLYGNIANILFRLGRFEEAEIYFEKAIDIAPHKDDLHYRLVDTLIQRKKWNSALEKVNKLLRRHPRNSDYLNLKGKILLHQNNPAQALRSFRMAIKSDPEKPAGYINAGVALMALGADKQAEKLLKAGLNFMPKDILPYLRLIDLNLRLMDHEEVKTLVRYLIQSASSEDISLSLMDIKDEPFNNRADYLKLEQTVAAEMEKIIPCSGKRATEK